MAKVFIEETTLTAIGDAIRGKEGTTALVPVTEMATRITDLPSGSGGVEFEDIVLTGDCSYACSGALANTIIQAFPSKITTENISNAEHMFDNSQLTAIPFEINIAAGSCSLRNMFDHAEKLTQIPDFDAKHTSYTSATFMFNACYSLTSLPKVHNVYPSEMQSFASFCRQLRYIPDDYFDTWNFDRAKSYASANFSRIFEGCWSLRKLPSSLFEGLSDWKATTSSYSPYYSTFNTCYTLDEIVGVPVTTATISSNCFNSIFNNCSHVSRITFKVNADGTPKTAKWKTQTIDLSTYVGYVYVTISMTDNNSGITRDTQVTDDASYQALKNDPDWWTTDINYSRYNHDSAVATINSLPDTSAYLATAGGTNTIKFKGASGSKTDGGAINTLTEEEIAVATAKGWTVTLV